MLSKKKEVYINNIFYVHGSQKARQDGQPRTATSTLTQLLNYDSDWKMTALLYTRSEWCRGMPSSSCFYWSTASLTCKVTILLTSNTYTCMNFLLQERKKHGQCQFTTQGRKCVQCDWVSIWHLNIFFTLWNLQNFSENI